MAFGSEEYLMHLVLSSVGQVLQLPCNTGSLCLVCTRSPCSATACPLNVFAAQVNNGEVACGAGQTLADELVGTCTVDACTAMVCNNHWIMHDLTVS